MINSKKNLKFCFLVQVKSFILCVVVLLGNKLDLGGKDFVSDHWEIYDQFTICRAPWLLWPGGVGARQPHGQGDAAVGGHHPLYYYLQLICNQVFQFLIIIEIENINLQYKCLILKSGFNNNLCHTYSYIRPR